MRVSEHYGLGLAQPSLDFVDVDVENDLRVFVDPRALRRLPSDWGDECVYLLQNFFETVLDAIGERRHADARALLRVLREPNETHLGFSRERSRGRALGSRSAADIWQALSRSEALQSGLLEDLEDAVLLVPGIGRDIVSDIATNIIRGPLITYTADVCEYYEIEMQADVASGPVWDPIARQWDSGFVALPAPSNRKLLLVPKAIVRHNLDYDAGEYYTHYLIPYLREVELAAGSALVEILKNGRRRVTRTALEAKYGTGKATIVQQTRRYPDVLRNYRRAKVTPRPPLSHAELADVGASPEPDWQLLLSDVLGTDPGHESADLYHRRVEGLLSAVFYPALVSPRREFKIHEGRKRIDIAYTNAASSGFFYWLGLHYPAAHVVVECKNYARPLGNPEFDQLAGRFSPSRGKFGLLVYRWFDDKDRFWDTCRDTARDDRGFMLPIDDDDLADLVTERAAGSWMTPFDRLREGFERLIT